MFLPGRRKPYEFSLLIWNWWGAMEWERMAGLQFSLGSANRAVPLCLFPAPLCLLALKEISVLYLTSPYLLKFLSRRFWKIFSAEWAEQSSQRTSHKYVHRGRVAPSLIFWCLPPGKGNQGFLFLIYVLYMKMLLESGVPIHTCM